MARSPLVIGALILLCCPMLGQTYRQKRTFRFQVRGEAGQPLPGTAVCASILGCHRTAPNGEVEALVPGPVVRLVKEGYCPVILLLKADADQSTIEVKLHPCADAVRKVPPCSAINVQGEQGRFVGVGFQAIFVPASIPILPGAGRGIVIVVSFVGFGEGETREWMMLGSGPDWNTGGLPRSELVEESVKMTDHSLITEGEGIVREAHSPDQAGEEEPFALDGVDIQGTLRDGRRWRYVGYSGASTSYGPVSSEAADFFDELLSTLCVPDSP